MALVVSRRKVWRFSASRAMVCKARETRATRKRSRWSSMYVRICVHKSRGSPAMVFAGFAGATTDTCKRISKSHVISREFRRKTVCVPLTFMHGPRRRGGHPVLRRLRRPPAVGSHCQAYCGQRVSTMLICLYLPPGDAWKSRYICVPEAEAKTHLHPRNHTCAQTSHGGTQQRSEPRRHLCGRVCGGWSRWRPRMRAASRSWPSSRWGAR